jgi:hypothetical protein
VAVTYTISLCSMTPPRTTGVSSLVVSDTLLSLSGLTKIVGDQDDLLEWGEAWIYTGSYVISPESGDIIDY